MRHRIIYILLALVLSIRIGYTQTQEFVSKPDAIDLKSLSVGSHFVPMHIDNSLISTDAMYRQKGGVIRYELRLILEYTQESIKAVDITVHNGGVQTTLLNPFTLYHHFGSSSISPTLEKVDIY